MGKEIVRERKINLQDAPKAWCISSNIPSRHAVRKTALGAAATTCKPTIIYDTKYSNKNVSVLQDTIV